MSVRDGLLHAEEQRVPRAAGQEAVYDVGDTKAAGRSEDPCIHLWKHGAALAQVDGKSSHAQYVRGAQAWALK